MDYGAPCPTIICNDNHLKLCFYEDLADDDNISDNSYPIIMMNFHNYLHYSFGSPGEELLYDHPYSDLGITSGGFYEIFDSDLLKQHQMLSSKHMHYDEERWKNYRHYVITFHDRLFECIAVNFSWDKRFGSIDEQAVVMAKTLDDR